MLDAKLVRSLNENSSPEVRSKVAARVSAELSKGELSDVERGIAIEIVEHLACDVEQQVRQALSEHIKSCPFLPTEVARELADDVDSVALPIIRYSSVLSEVDLISIVRRGSQIKHLAVAQRQSVPGAVA